MGTHRLFAYGDTRVYILMGTQGLIPYKQEINVSMKLFEKYMKNYYFGHDKQDEINQC